LNRWLVALAAACLPLTGSCGGKNDNGETGNEEDASRAALVRQVAGEFLEGNKLPRSFLGDAGHVADADQRRIAEEGVVLYDMAVLLKALLLYPAENAGMIGQLVGALRDGTDVRSNTDFTYDAPVPRGEGYFYKIIHVNATWLYNQSQPITGENAWVANAMAAVHDAFPGTATGRDALAILSQLARAIMALQTPSGLARMAPAEPGHYAYMGVDYHETASVENNLSCIPALKYMSGHAATAAERAACAAALEKLEDAVLEMYNAGGRYFNTGKNLGTGEVNAKFATDCQTWCVLAFGPARLDELMLARHGVTNASERLLERALEIAGVKREGEYAGLDFYDRASVVSFEWSSGFVAAARAVLATRENATLRRAEASISAYIREHATPPGLLPYTDANTPVDTGHGWTTIPLMYSLASSAWLLFDTLEASVSPFDI
jgi:hypothetical protein